MYESAPGQHPSWAHRDPTYSENSHDRASTCSYPNSQSVSRSNSQIYSHGRSRRENRYHQYHGGESSFVSDAEPNAVALVEDGRSLIVDVERIARWGGIESLRRRLESETNGDIDGGVIEEFTGATHVLLPNMSLSEDVHGLLSALLPIISSTLVVLDVSTCCLDALPQALSRCLVLEELNVSGNPLASLPSWLGQLSSLRVLVVDGCNLKQLPIEMMNSRNLHTICARRNALISLPSWLSQLSKLQTLLVDDNPFVGQWRDLVKNISTVPDVEEIPPVPQIPARFTANRQETKPGIQGQPSGPSYTGYRTPIYVNSAAPSMTSLQSSLDGRSDDVQNAEAPINSFYQTPCSSMESRGSPYGGMASPTSTSMNQNILSPDDVRHSSLTSNMTTAAGSPDGNLAMADLAYGDPAASPSIASTFLTDRTMSVAGTDAADKPATVITSRAPHRQPTSRFGSTYKVEGGSSKVVRRMRSAGNLLGFRNQSQDQLREIPAFHATSDVDDALEPPQPRFATFSSRNRARAATSMSNYQDDSSTEDERLPNPATVAAPSPRSVSAGNAPAQNKTGKWGFLKKMSMSRIRSNASSPGNGHPSRPAAPSQSKSVSSAAGLVTGPRRPSLGTPAYSTGTLPSASTGLGTDRYGPVGRTQQGTLRIQATLPTVDASPPHPSHQRGKRRSFLPIWEPPPALNIAIPSISPFISGLAVMSPAELASAEPSLTSKEEILADPAPKSTQNTIRERNATDRTGFITERAVPYDVGLRSIMSYLRDLYDLSLPVPPSIGGAEVVASDVGTGSSSVSAGSDIRAESPSPVVGQVGRFNTMRSRKPIGGEIAGEASESSLSLPHGGIGSSPLSRVPTDGPNNSVNPRPQSLPKEVDDDVAASKKYRDDAGKRAGVVRHILETERTYVQGLRELVDIYVTPASAIISSKTGETVIPVNERKIVFGGIEGILRFHMDSFLPALEGAAKELIQKGDDPTGEVSKRAANNFGQVFRSYNPFMRQYSAYINNFDFALQRLRKWTAHSYQYATTSPVSAGSSPTAGVMIGMGLGMSAVTPPSTPDPSSNQASLPLTSTQRKRIRTFLQNCRSHPRHSQINLESYLLLPVQRIPRYRLLLEDLARSTPPAQNAPYDTLEDALQEITALASSMNEEKRDSESRRRLVTWQSRIRGKFATPLVQAHRRLLLDGHLTLSRVVKRANVFVEVPVNLLPSSAPPSAPGSPFDSGAASADSDNGDQDHTITAQKAIVQIEALTPEISNRRVAVVLTSDLMILCKEVLPPPTPAFGELAGASAPPSAEGLVDLYAVLRLQTKRRPASLVRGNEIRLVDNKSILYFTAPSSKEAIQWVKTINTEFDPMR